MRSGSGLADAASGLNLLNNGARPRQAAWVDVDGDGLQLFVYGIWSRSQLFKQAPGGGFADIAGESGIQSTVNGLSAWFDADADADPDLLVSARDEFVLYLNEKGLFREIRLGRNPHGMTGAPPEYRQFGRPAFADFDGDGDIDIFVASANGSTLILNLGGTFRLEEPAARGLPSRAAAAAWVDADNDSLPDLQSVPDGLFLQTRGHRFERTGLLACDSAEPIAAGRCLWFDADNDGDRDVIISLLPRDGEAARLWSSKVLLERGIGPALDGSGSRRTSRKSRRHRRPCRRRAWRWPPPDGLCRLGRGIDLFSRTLPPVFRTGKIGATEGRLGPVAGRADRARSDSRTGQAHDFRPRPRSPRTWGRRGRELTLGTPAPPETGFRRAWPRPPWRRRAAWFRPFRAGSGASRLRLFSGDSR